MLRIKRYVRAQSAKEAYTLLTQKRSNVVLGGMLWLKMQNKTVDTAIDLQDLGLNEITQTPDAWEIGCMVSLRDLELHKGLNDMTSGAISDSVRHIVGVQFRNTATVGGSIYGRFGFSDVLPLFLVLNAKIDLYHRGIISLEEFIHLPRSDRDLLLRVIVPKAKCRTVYLSQRNSATDFPVLTCALSQTENELVCAVGARPGKAICVRSVPSDADSAVADLSSAISFGSNVRASAAYRKEICRVLIRRAIKKLQSQEPEPWKLNSI